MTTDEYKAYLAGRGAPTQAAPAKPRSDKPSPANALTQAVIQLLQLHGFTAWRQNNGGVYDPTKKVFRANSSTPGISDVLGYHRATGILCAVEVKVGSDKLSPAQKSFLQQVRAAGGFAQEARDIAQVEAALKEYLSTLPTP